MNTLVAEIGNTNIVIGVHDGESWKHKFRYETKEDQPFVFFEVGLRDLLLEWNLSPQDITAVGMSSVVPEMNERIIKAMELNTRQVPKVLDAEMFESLDMRVPKPYEIGADIVANAYAALRKFNTDCIVADFGTALTFSIVTQDEGIRGVTIAPGIMTAIKAISFQTAQLPEVEMEIPESVIGYDTDTALRAGVLYGYVGLVKEIVNRMKEERPGDYTVIAAGGLCSALPPLIPFFDVIDRDLTLDGIRYLVQD